MNAPNRINGFTMTLLAGILSVSVVSATPMLVDYHDGSVTPFVNWFSEDADSAVNYNATLTLNDATLGNPTPGLRINPTSVLGAVPVTALVYTTDPLLVGNLTSYAGVSFDFFAGANNGTNGAPASLSLYFYGNDQAWYYDIGSAYTISDGWGTYGSSFQYAPTWTTLGTGGEAAFLLSLGNVGRLGIEITYFSSTEQANQVYGIDNFGLTVPEPETYMVLGMALLTVAFVFRKRITESLAEARTMMQM